MRSRAVHVPHWTDDVQRAVRRHLGELSQLWCLRQCMRRGGGVRQRSVHDERLPDATATLRQHLCQFDSGFQELRELRHGLHGWTSLRRRSL
jgi:hypothetical protein